MKIGRYSNPEPSSQVAFPAIVDDLRATMAATPETSSQTSSEAQSTVTTGSTGVPATSKTPLLSKRQPATHNPSGSKKPAGRARIRGGTCTHLNMVRMYTTEHRCMVCDQVGAFGWVYRCTQDRNPLIEYEIGAGVADYLDDLCHELPKSNIPQKRSAAARESPLSLLEEIPNEAWSQYSPAQIATLLSQRAHLQKVLAENNPRDPATGAMDHLEPAAVACTNFQASLGYAPVKPWIPVAECQFRCCPRCRPIYREKVPLSLNAIMAGDIPATAITGFGFHLKGARPVVPVDIWKNIGLRPNPEVTLQTLFMRLQRRGTLPGSQIKSILRRALQDPLLKPGPSDQSASEDNIQPNDENAPPQATASGDIITQSGNQNDDPAVLTGVSIRDFASSSTASHSPFSFLNGTFRQPLQRRPTTYPNPTIIVTPADSDDDTSDTVTDLDSEDSSSEDDYYDGERLDGEDEEGEGEEEEEKQDTSELEIDNDAGSSHRKLVEEYGKLWPVDWVSHPTTASASNSHPPERTINETGSQPQLLEISPLDTSTAKKDSDTTTTIPPLTPMEALEAVTHIFNSQPLQVAGGVAVLEESVKLHEPDILT